VLEKINITINANENIGIIGRTGSGKTTFINLIGRLFDPSEGKILIDGIDVKDYSFDELNNNVAIGMQAVTLFSGTIKTNIAMGLSSKLSSEEIKKKAIEAAKVAEA
jgi:ATP-binding cassette subfamily B protein